MSNVFTCVATITRDAEQRFLPSGQSVLNVSVANNQGFGEKQTTLFIRVAVWGKKAESGLIDYLKKGQKILISGELTQREYEKDGQTKVSLELNATIIDLVGGKREEQPAQQRPAQSSPTKPRDNFDPEDFDDQIPF